MDTLLFMSPFVAGALLFLGISVVLTVYGVRQIRHARRAVKWPTVHATLRKAVVRRHVSEAQFLAYAHFEYSIDGTAYESHQCSLVDRWWNTHRDAEAQLERIERTGVEDQVVAYVNPNDPTEAVLVPGGRGSFPLTLVAGLVTLAFIAWWVFFIAANMAGSRGAMFGVVSLAAIMSAAPIAMGVIMWRGIKTWQWTPTPGTLEHARVAISSGGDGPSYRVNLAYTYEVGGRTYHGHRDQFGCATGGRKRTAEKRAATIEAASQSAEGLTVYYNPEHPHDAVLKRGFNAFALTMFILSGGATLFLACAAYEMWIANVAS